MTWKIPLFKMYTDENDVKAVTKVIRRGSYWAIGPEVEDFEKRIAKFLGVKYALAFNSGTSAIHAMLLAVGIENKEVIVPSFTFIATVNPVLLAGGIPIFTETETETYGLDIKDIEHRINPETKAIMAFHYGGFPSRDIKKLRILANKKKILLLEDACQSLGASINGKKVGTFGDVACFSLCQSKIISTGEGGLLVTDNERIYNKAKLLRSHGRVELATDYFSTTKESHYIRAGYNFRMPSMNAALGISQLKKINFLANRRRKLAYQLSQALKPIKQIKTMQEAKGHFSVYQMFTIELPSQEIRDKLQKHLEKKGIMSKVYFNPIHLMKIYQERDNERGDLPATEALAQKVLTIPLYPSMNDFELNYLIKSIKEFDMNIYS